ncbi:sensor histidine kinase [Polaribacter sp. Hel_I_88]|uniref:sensor histidine kinase n=1 Tax=Polaribacter sp. Hel_I_88 TaxID=1250006 RepID=UPI00047E5E04|nr:sensor histidine kinase [Polaribacter sp. Hel_I_88]
MKLYKNAIFLVIFLFSIQATFSLEFETAQQPSIEITTEQFQHNKTIKLDQHWEFYWKDFINPGNFNHPKVFDSVSLTSWTNYKDTNNKPLPSFGYATYRLLFSIPKGRPSTSLYIPLITASSKIWINGVFILETGQVGTSKSKTLHRSFTKIIPLDSQETNFEVVIQVANFYHKKGGITTPILLGTTDQLFQKKSLQIMTDMISIGSFSFIGILFLVFYLLYWSKDQAVLYFSILCICMAYHTLNERYAPLAIVFSKLSWVFLVKLEYISSYLAGLFASLFFAIILKEFTHSWYKKTMITIISILVFLVLVLPSPYFTQLIVPFFICMLLNIVYVIFISIQAILAKSAISRLLIFTIIACAITFSGHILFFMKENELALIYIKFAYIIVFLLISMLMLHRFSNSFRQLALANAFVLEQKREISQKSDEISKANLKLEENLNQLKAKITELDDFNHIVSHDLKTPLISVYSLASFIEEDLKDNLNASTKSHIVMMKDVVSKMEASINGLLAYSKVTITKKVKSNFLLNDLLKKITNSVDPQHKNIIHLPKNNIEIFASEIELEHVFQNLITNAIKYNNKEKAIIIIAAAKEKTNYVFSVQDNGPGIPEEYHSKIFDIFSQLDTDEKDLKSTGIGLAIVKKIVHKNQGQLTVTSKENNGLKIEFTIAISPKTNS